MSALGDLLVLLHDAPGRVSTVRATVRLWSDVRAAQTAMQRHARRAGATLYAVGGEAPEEQVRESVARVWFAPGDRVREEREGADGERFGVRRGQWWWDYDAHTGVMSNQDEPDTRSGIGEEFRWLAGAAPVMGLLEFHDIAPSRCAGRPTLRTRALPRRLADGEDWPLVRLGAAGADELRLEVDAERGTLLRIESRVEGRPFAVSEVLAVAFDERFAPETFEFEPPEGEQVRTLSDLYAIEHDITIERAVALAPFAVWIPARVPSGWELSVRFAAERHRPPSAPHVHLHYAAPDATHDFQIAESPAGHPGEHVDYDQARANPWESVERDQRSIEIREPAEGWQSAQARLELDGTHILIVSDDLGADALADLAAGLVRAPSTPPDLAP